MTLIIQFTPEVSLPPVASDELITVAQNSTGNVVTTQVTVGGVVTTPDSIAVTQPANGVATVDGLVVTYTPADGYVGADSFTYTGTTLGGDSNAAVVSVTVQSLTCTEFGRVTRCYVSGYQRSRVHESRLVRGESRCLIANFNGAVDKARAITSVTWRCEQPYIVAMSDARVIFGSREVAVDIAAQLPGCAWLKCIATLDNGEMYTQLFRVVAIGGPWFDGETTPSAGPTSLTSP